MSISLTKLGKISVIIFQISFNFLPSLLSFHHLPDVNIGTLEVVPQTPYTVFIFFGFCFLLFRIGIFWFLILQIADLILYSTVDPL